MIPAETILGLVCLGGLSAFFSAGETALFSLGRAGRSRLRRETPFFGHKVLELLADPQKLLGTILFGNMLVNILIFSLAQKIVDQWVSGMATEGWATVLTLGIPVVGILFVGEVIPKTVAMCFPFRTALIVAYPLSWMMFLLSPVVGGLRRLMPRSVSSSTTFNSDELERLVDETTAKGELAETEGDLLKDLIRFGTLEASDVMIPRTDIEAVALRGSREDLLEKFRRTGLNKLPVYTDNLDDISGVVSLRDAISRPGAHIRDLLRTLPIYPEQIRVSRLYQLMRSRQEKIALVVDEYGGTAGILTFKSLLEEIVGEFNEDLVEEDPEIIWVNDSTCRISGQMALRDFEEITGHRLKDGPYLTVAGWILENTERMPRPGEIVSHRGLEFRVVEVSRFRLETVEVLGLSRPVIEGQA